MSPPPVPPHDAHRAAPATEPHPAPDARPGPASRPAAGERWSRFASATARGWRAYARWLVGISWKRFALMSLLLLVLASVLENVPPFSWTISETVRPPRISITAPPAPPAPPAPGASPAAAGSGASSDEALRYEVTIDERGIRVVPRAASGAASSPREGASAALPPIDIQVPEGVDTREIRDRVREAIDDARESIQDAANDAAEARADAAEALSQPRVIRVRLGDALMDLAFVFILTSAIVKVTYTGRLKAEVQAAQATETAEDESLKRQVVEARMAAMQAQVEPHFLFNTLASIDHLIETDPRRASAMQKNLIALLRASMPTMREVNAQAGPGHLGRELSLVRPYLELLKMRMEERLQADIQVPEGLLSAEFPPMMIQGLVENAIKHGLEPKPEGGRLLLRAEIVHGDLAVTVEDSGLGFGRSGAAGGTAGTGVGLANIRERLALLYGAAARLTITEPADGGTRVVISVPYKPVVQARA